MTGLLIAVTLALGSRIVFGRRASWSSGLRAPPGRGRVVEISFFARRPGKSMREAA